MCTALLSAVTVLRNETQVLKTRTASRGFKLPGGWWSGWFFSLWKVRKLLEAHLKLSFSQTNPWNLVEMLQDNACVQMT